MASTETSEPRSGGDDLATVDYEGPASVATSTRVSANDKSTSQPVRIGRFTVLRPLGEGGMGRVYAAYDEELDRRVAIKVLRKVSRVSKERVRREAQAMARLSHPNVVQIFEVGEHAGSVFIAMEYAEGDTLDRWQRQRGRTWQAVLGAYRQAAEGLCAAHEAGLVHRDFKPANATVESLGGGRIRVRVFDFGLAQRTDQMMSDRISSVDPSELPGSLDSIRLTKTGGMLGTPAYMAPEQAGGQPVDETADQFSFCVALWEGLFGMLPFPGSTVSERRDAIEQGRVRRPSRDSAVPGWLRAILERGLAADPRDRHPGMRALVEALKRDPARKRRRWLGAFGFAVVVLGTSGGFHVWSSGRSEPCRGGDKQVAAVWNDDARRSVSQALLATDRPYAGSTSSYVARQLDDYTAQWVDAFTDTCEATTVRNEQSTDVMDLRMACLHRAKQGVASVVAVLSNADATVLDNASKVIGGLDSLQRCDDVEALRSEDEPSANATASVERIRELLTNAETEREAGRHEKARRFIEAAKVNLAEAEYPPIRTQVALEDAEILRAAGDYASAETTLLAALRDATANNQREAMFRATSTLIFVVAYEQRNVDEGLRYRELAEGLAKTTAQRGALHAVLGAVHSAQGHWRAAGADFREALALTQAAMGSEHPRTMMLRKNVAISLIEDGQLEEAMRILRDLLKSKEDSFGPEHPEVADLRDAIGVTLFQQGELASAQTELQEALRIRELTLGLHHPSTCNTRNSFAGVLEAQGNFAQAEAAIRQSLAGWKKTLGPAHPSVAMAHQNLGQVLWPQGRVAAGEAEFRRGLEIVAEALGPDHPEVADGKVGLAELLLGDGRATDALPLAEHAWEIRQGDDIPAKARGNAAFVLAKALSESDSAPRARKRALELADRAIREYRSSEADCTQEIEMVQGWLEDGG